MHVSLHKILIINNYLIKPILVQGAEGWGKREKKDESK